jgi:gas vesicle protein
MSLGSRRVQTSLVVAAVAGGALGALVGILAAPASGEETRNRLSRRIGEGTDSLLRKSQEAMEQMGGLARRAG